MSRRFRLGDPVHHRLRGRDEVFVGEARQRSFTTVRALMRGAR